jgi:hypothetical protein
MPGLVCLLGPISVAFAILSFHGTHNFAQDFGGSCGEPREATSPEDAARWEVKRAPGEETCAWRERERDRRAAEWAVRR